MTVEATHARLVSLATALAEEAARASDARRAQALLALRERLIEVTGPPTITMEELLQELLAAREAGELTSMVAALRPVLGYEFYAALAELIEAADDPGEKSDLEALRAAMLESSDELDAQAEAELARVARRLEAVLLAPDPAKLLEEQADSIDEAFLLVTEANLRMALEQGRAEEAAKLQQVLDATFAVLERRLPPQIRLVNQLARCEDDECREQLIGGSPELIDDDLLEMLRATAARAREGDAIPVADSLEAAAKLAVDRLAATGGADDADGTTDGAAPSPQGDE